MHDSSDLFEHIDKLIASEEGKHPPGSHLHSALERLKAHTQEQRKYLAKSRQVTPQNAQALAIEAAALNARWTESLLICATLFEEMGIDYDRALLERVQEFKSPTDSDWSRLQRIQWKVNEAGFFLQAMEKQSETILGSLRFGDFSWQNSAHYAAAQVFLFNFAAMLSAWRSATYYIEKACEKRGRYAQEWFKSLRDRKLLAAFSFLRDADVHRDTLKPGVRYTVTMEANPAERTASQEFCLDGNALRKLDHFEKYPWTVDVLTERPILVLAKEALSQLREVIREGLQSGCLP